MINNFEQIFKLSMQSHFSNSQPCYHKNRSFHRFDLGVDFFVFFSSISLYHPRVFNAKRNERNESRSERDNSSLALKRFKTFSPKEVNGSPGARGKIKNKNNINPHTCQDMSFLL